MEATRPKPIRPPNKTPIIKLERMIKIKLIISNMINPFVVRLRND